MKLDLMDAAICLDDLKYPPSNYLHQLHGSGYKDCWAVSVNGPWRLVFRFENEGIFDVRLEQYH